MKRNLISVVAAFALLLSLCPLPAFAAAGDFEASVKVDGNTTNYSTFKEAWDAAQTASTQAIVTLLKDVDYKPPETTDAAILLTSGDVTLTGPGHTLTLDWPSGIRVNGGKLTVENVTVKAWETPINIDGDSSSVTINRDANIQSTFTDTNSACILINAGTLSVSGSVKGMIAVHINKGGTTVTINEGAQLTGSLYALKNDTGTLGDILGSGCAIYKDDGTGVDRTNENIGRGTFTVKKCDHAGVEITDQDDGTHGVTSCPYCGGGFIHDTTLTATANGNTVTLNGTCKSCDFQSNLGSAAFTFENMTYGSAKVKWTKTGLDNVSILLGVDDKDSAAQTAEELTLGKNAGTHTLNVSFGMGTSKSNVCPLSFEIGPAPLTEVTLTASNRSYEPGNRTVIVSSATGRWSWGDSQNVQFANIKGTISGENVGTYDEVNLENDVVDIQGNYIISKGPYPVKSSGNSNGVEITPATYNGTKNARAYAKVGTSGTYDLSALLPDWGKLETPSIKEDTNSIFEGAPSLDGTQLKYTLVADESKVGKSGTITIPVTSTNYQDFNLSIEVTATKTDVPTLSIDPITVTYTGKPVPASAIKGTAKVGDKTVDGTWSFDGADSLTNVAHSGTKHVIFTPTDQTNYAVALGTVQLTINKATPTGEPTGTLSWDLDPSTPVSANTPYEWSFAPNDADNYNPLSGKLTPWVQQSSGGSGSGSLPTPSPDPNPSPDPDPSPDPNPSLPDDPLPSNQPSTPPVSTSGQESNDSDTATTAQPPANVNKGSASATVDQAMGDEILRQAVENQSQSVVIAPNMNGDVSKTQVSLPANTVDQIASQTNANLTVSTPLANVTFPNSSLEALASNGGQISLSTQISDNTLELTISANGEPVSDLPASFSLTVPFSNPKPGTVATLILPDGSRQVVRSSTTSDNSITIPLNGSAKLEISNNAKKFSDIPPLRLANRRCQLRLQPRALRRY